MLANTKSETKGAVNFDVPKPRAVNRATRQHTQHY